MIVKTKFNPYFINKSAHFAGYYIHFRIICEHQHERGIPHRYEQLSKESSVVSPIPMKNNKLKRRRKFLMLTKGFKRRRKFMKPTRGLK